MLEREGSVEVVTGGDGAQAVNPTARFEVLIQPLLKGAAWRTQCSCAPARRPTESLSLRRPG